MEIIKVKAAQPDEVALWEVNPDHPGGEVLVAGPSVFEVATTPKVLHKLATGELVKVGGEKAAPVAPAPEAGDTKKRK